MTRLKRRPRPYLRDLESPFVPYSRLQNDQSHCSCLSARLGDANVPGCLGDIALYSIRVPAGVLTNTDIGLQRFGDKLSCLTQQKGESRTCLARSATPATVNHHQPRSPVLAVSSVSMNLRFDSWDESCRLPSPLIRLVPEAERKVRLVQCYTGNFAPYQLSRLLPRQRCGSDQGFQSF